MKKFEKPVVEVIDFAVEDVITTSNGGEQEEIPALVPPCVS